MIRQEARTQAINIRDMMERRMMQMRRASGTTKFRDPVILIISPSLLVEVCGVSEDHSSLVIIHDQSLL